MRTVACDSIPQQLVPGAARIRPGVPFDPAEATRAYLATVPRRRPGTLGRLYRGRVLDSGLGGSPELGDPAPAASDRLVPADPRLGRAADPTSPDPRVSVLAVFTLVVTVLTFPFTVYTGFVREHAYGLATQGFGGWLRDQAVGLGVSLVLGGIAVAVLYQVLHRFPRAWPALGAAVTMVFLVIGAVIAPVFIAPLFNRFTLLEDARIRDPILRLAHANGIATDRVYVMDASRQTTRISANVSGLLGTERITLNDNLLRRASLPEIEAVMGHEMGHYVLLHIYQFVVFFALVTAVGFALLRTAYAWVAVRWGERWGIRGVDDPAGLPLLTLIFSLYLFLLTPILNTYVRTSEAAADIFGLNAARQPDGFALIALKLADYRKLEPGPLEELLWYDHPSGRTRIRMAMQWKAALESGRGNSDR